MNRYRHYGTLDDQPELVGDAEFKRLDMVSDPATLPPGTVQVSENFRFDTQQVRAGISRKFAPGTDIGRILFDGIYQPVRGNDQFALVTANALALFNPAGQTVTLYPFPSGQSLGVGQAVDFVQNGIGSGTLPTAWILRGTDATALKFDPNASPAIIEDPDFEPGDFGISTQGRVLVADSAQSAQVSDFDDLTTWSALNQFQLLKGGDDYLVNFYEYQKDLVIVGCRKRFMIAFFDPKTTTAGYVGGLDATTSFLRNLTREAGLVGRHAMIEANGLIWFITDNGIYAFQPRLDLELTVLGEPISADIQPIMDRLSAKYASGACIERHGFRLYFAMPISDEPIGIVGMTFEATSTVGVDLPFDLPVLLATGTIATVETGEDHDVSNGDTVQIAGAIDSQLNGEFTVLSVTDSRHFTVATEASVSAIVGDRVTTQKIATRNNLVAVYNLKNEGWESIDSLPSGFFADSLRVAESGARRRLWVVDRTSGPALYEEGEADEIGDIAGGLSLPFDLPAEFSTANFASAPIPGRLKSRVLRWGGFAREVRAGRARLTVGNGDAGTLTVRVRTPNANVWTGTREFDGTGRSDLPVRTRSGKRGLEAELELVTTSGRPTVRELQVEMTAAGRVTEE